MTAHTTLPKHPFETKLSIDSVICNTEWVNCIHLYTEFRLDCVIQGITANSYCVYVSAFAPFKVQNIRINWWINAFGTSYSDWNVHLIDSIYTPVWIRDFHSRWWFICLFSRLDGWFISINIENYYHAII